MRACPRDVANDEHPAPRGRAARVAFTLVEMLVAATLALVAMGAVATLFSVLGRGVSQSQTLVELNGRMRNASWQLRQDLTGLTAPVAVWVRSEANAGYVAVTEGAATTSGTALIGDCDDTLSLTTTSLGQPFMGRLNGAEGFESPTAEVAWFCEPSERSFGGRQLFDLHRRQLLVAAAPAAGDFQAGVSVASTAWRSFYAANDLSCRSAGGRLFANSLGDLTVPGNRLLTVSGSDRRLQDARRGEDVILTNVVAFDVQVWGANDYVDGAFATQYSETGSPPTPPPPPLRGLRVRIRCVDPASGQIRQLTLVHSFEAG